MDDQSYLEITGTFLAIYVAATIIMFLILTLKKKKSPLVRQPPEMVTHNLWDGSMVPTKETDVGKLWAMICREECPVCGSIERGFYAGPEGGMSQNIECANPNCKARFNVTPTIGIAERI